MQGVAKLEVRRVVVLRVGLGVAVVSEDVGIGGKLHRPNVRRGPAVMTLLQGQSAHAPRLVDQGHGRQLPVHQRLRQLTAVLGVGRGSGFGVAFGAGSRYLLLLAVSVGAGVGAGARLLLCLLLLMTRTATAISIVGPGRAGTGHASTRGPQPPHLDALPVVVRRIVRVQDRRGRGHLPLHREGGLLR